jgi:hypothetical protein
MKNYLLLIIILFSFISCKNKEIEKKQNNSKNEIKGTQNTPPGDHYKHNMGFSHNHMGSPHDMGLSNDFPSHGMHRHGMNRNGMNRNGMNRRRNRSMRGNMRNFHMGSPHGKKWNHGKRGHRDGVKWGKIKKLDRIFGNVDFVKKQLEINDEQVDKVVKLNLKYTLKYLDFRKKITPLKIDLRKQLLIPELDMKKIREILTKIAKERVEVRILKISHRVEIEKILTKNQYATLKRLLRKRELF